MGEVVNPYSAPESAVDVGVLRYPLAPAGRWRRFFTYVVDSIGMALCNTAAEAGVMAMNHISESGLGLGTRFGLSFGISLLYYIAFEATWGRTPGKWICGTVVVDMTGAPPTVLQVLKRSLARYIPFEPFSLLFSNDSDTRGWHDSLAKTRVVLAKPSR
jgi:uncharacterized RDD family membrane protein YckC